MTTSLRALLPNFDLPDIPVTGIALDSRRVEPGQVFIALKGQAHDGRCFIPNAVAAGACAVLCDAAKTEGDAGIPVIAVPGLSAEIGEIASRFYDAPSAQLTVVAVTGTNGKTSVTYLAASALDYLKRTAGIIGTLGQGFLDDLKVSGLTTPDAVVIQSSLKSMLNGGAEMALIEASSHGLVQNRLTGTSIQAAVFTNVTRDHLDYHGDMASYRQAKAKLIQWPGLKCALLNLDDPWLASLAQAPQVSEVLGFSQLDAPSALIRAEALQCHEAGIQFSLRTPAGVTSVRSALLGRHNVSNLLAVAGLLYWYGVELDDIGAALSNCQLPPGRLQRLPHSDRAVLVDFAHTPDAVTQVLQSLRLHFKGRLICVLGCGGDRDSGKRPLMGAAAVRHSDRCLFTSDNPRSENPSLIIDDMCRDLPSPMDPADCLTDRTAAIQRALTLQQPSDVVVILGKGHEQYQEIEGVRYPFNDQQVVAAQLLQWGAQS
jgi:UDP-N-acetylmuramoyl-L-alanyl-D-glutamate--2,6-diaminopimelate ligase